MTVLVVDRYVIKQGKEDDFKRLWQRTLKYKKENPEKLKELKSIKLYTQMFGGISGSQIEISEFNSLTDYENLGARVMKDEEMKKIHAEFMALKDLTTRALSTRARYN
jgi:DNA/RNA-binding domain of Phe-tRNA-synthetase-like protein